MIDRRMPLWQCGRSAGGGFVVGVAGHHLEASSEDLLRRFLLRFFLPPLLFSSPLCIHTAQTLSGPSPLWFADSGPKRVCSSVLFAGKGRACWWPAWTTCGAPTASRNPAQTSTTGAMSTMSTSARHGQTKKREQQDTRGPVLIRSDPQGCQDNRRAALWPIKAAAPQRQAGGVGGSV